MSMKESTVHTLVAARELLDDARRHCGAGDRYRATAGIIVLQDAVELILLAMLIELGADEEAALEKLTFDQLIGELRSRKVEVPKSGTLKAMNRLRVAAKHYGQLMEPATVQGHLEAALQAIEAVLQSVVGKPLREVYLTELVQPSEARMLLEEAATELSRDRFFESLVASRKAFFLEFEFDYCIFSAWNGSQLGSLLSQAAWGGGWKAPFWSRDPTWIATNVTTPFEFVQVDAERWRIDAMEWGINAQTLDNIRMLTPQLVRLGSSWHQRLSAGYAANMCVHENAAYCLDLVTQVVRKKQEHFRGYRQLTTGKPFQYPPAYVGQPMFVRPTLTGGLIRTLQADDRYVVEQVMHGFDANLVFYLITTTDSAGLNHRGYVQQLQTQSLEQGPVPPITTSPPVPTAPPAPPSFLGAPRPPF